MVTFDVYRPSRQSSYFLGGQRFHGKVLTQRNVIILGELQHVGYVKRDYGYIRTTPSAFFPRRFNDCFQYEVEGEFRKLDLGGMGFSADDFDTIGAPKVTVTTPAGESRVTSGCMAVIDSSGTILNSWRLHLGSVSKRYILEWELASVEVDNGKFTFYCQCTYTTYNSQGEETSHDSQLVCTGRGASASRIRDFDSYEGAITVGYGDVMLGLPLAEKDPIVKGLISQLFEQCHDGELSLKAGESVRLANINGLAYIRDFITVGKLADSLLSVSGIGKSAKATAKIAASVYLATHYGLKLSILDSQEIQEGVMKLDLDHALNRIGAEHNCMLELPGYPEVTVAARSRLSGYIKNWSTEQRFFVDKVKQTCRAMWEFDAVPTFANLWDFLPWTFVVDWFLPIGQAAEKLETAHYLHHLETVRLFYSKKFTWSQDLHWKSDNWSGYTGHVTSKVYIRTTEKEFVIPPLRVNSPLRNLGHHWLEASALLIQVKL